MSDSPDPSVLRDEPSTSSVPPQDERACTTPPTPRRTPRHNEWTRAKMAAFRRELAASQSVAQAARSVGMGRQSAYKLRLPGTSDVIYNVGGYYEKYGLSLRLQYQRRSTYLDSIADQLSDAGDTYWAADDELDFSARYAFTDNLEVYFDATNLLDNPGRRYADPGSLLAATGVPTKASTQNTIEWERFGRRYAAGVWVNF